LEVEGTDDFRDWYLSLGAKDRDAVTYVVDLLEIFGVNLDYPYCSKIAGSKVLRELRTQSGGRPLRVFYAFDPRRHAILLIGGDKTNDKRFYARLVPRAERLYAEYIDDLKKEKRLK